MRPERALWMDLCRGLAILAVVVHHALMFTADAGAPLPEVIRRLDDGLQAFRMPLLVALTGLLVPRALGKPLRVYVAGKARTLLWPYLLWAPLSAVAMGTTPSLATVGADVILPGPLLWYLWALMAYFAVAPVIARLPVARLPLAALAVAASLAVPDPTFRSVVYLFGFFLLGWWLATDGARPGVRGHHATVALGIAAAGVVAIAGFLGVEVRYHALWVLGPVGLVVAVVALAGARSAPPVIAGPGRTAIEWVGRNSIVFYLVHGPVLVVVLAVAKRILPMSAPMSVWTAVVLAEVMLALGIATVATAMRSRSAVAVLFELPRRSGRRSAHRAAPERSRAGAPS